MATVTLIAGQTRLVFGHIFRRGVPAEVSEHLDYFAASPEFEVAESGQPAQAPEPDPAPEPEAAEPEQASEAKGGTMTTADLPESGKRSRARK